MHGPRRKMKNFAKYLTISAVSFLVGVASIYLVFSLYIKTIDKNRHYFELYILEKLVVEVDKNRCINADVLLDEYERKVINGPDYSSTDLLDVLLGAYIGDSEFMEKKEYRKYLSFLKRLVNEKSKK
jgi:hypothetical protein